MTACLVMTVCRVRRKGGGARTEPRRVTAACHAASARRLVHRAAAAGAPGAASPEDDPVRVRVAEGVVAPRPSHRDASHTVSPRRRRKSAPNPKRAHPSHHSHRSRRALRAMTQPLRKLTLDLVDTYNAINRVRAPPRRAGAPAAPVGGSWYGGAPRAGLRGGTTTRGRGRCAGAGRSVRAARRRETTRRGWTEGAFLPERLPSPFLLRSFSFLPLVASPARARCDERAATRRRAPSR